MNANGVGYGVDVDWDLQEIKVMSAVKNLMTQFEFSVLDGEKRGRSGRNGVGSQINKTCPYLASFLFSLPCSMKRTRLATMPLFSETSIFGVRTLL